MPTATVAAVPRVQMQPQTATEKPDFKASSGILNASLLGRLFATPEPDNGHLSETDTSLYDYAFAKNTTSSLPYVIPCVFML